MDALEYAKKHSEDKAAALDQMYIDRVIMEKGELWVAVAIEYYMDLEDNMSEDTHIYPFTDEYGYMWVDPSGI